MIFGSFIRFRRDKRLHSFSFLIGFAQILKPLLYIVQSISCYLALAMLELVACHVHDEFEEYDRDGERCRPAEIGGENNRVNLAFLF